MLRWLIRLAIYGALAGAAFYIWQKYYAGNPQAIASRGGRSLFVKPGVNAPLYLQRDPQWINDKLGSTPETMGSVGRLVCSVTMAANAFGERITPKELNETLSNRNGYTADGWLIWSKIAEVFEKRIDAVIAERPTHAAIDRALERGELPLVKFLISGVIPHWVVVVGKHGEEYLIRDPLENTPEFIRLSDQTEKIQSLRILKKQERDQ